MDKPERYKTYNEIFDQKRSIRNAFEKYKGLFCNFNYDGSVMFEDEDIVTVFTGCGSSYYLGQCLSSAFNRVTSQYSIAIPASEVYLSHDCYLKKHRRYRLVSISRSATTSETVEASKFFKNEIGGDVIAISCCSVPPLNQIADLVLFEDSGMDESIVMTKSFSTMLFMGLMLTAYIGRDRGLCAQFEKAVDKLARVVDESTDIALDLCNSFRPDQIFLLGNGPFYGISSEGMLKAKEMSLTSSENYHFLEIRHGPMSMVDTKTLIVGLLSKNNTGYQVSLLKDMKEIGAKIFIICDEPDDLGRFKPDWSFFIKSGLSDEVNCLLSMPSLQFLALYHSLNKGLDVDKPRNLVKVVRI